MSNSAHRIDKFMNGPGGRADDWRDLVEAAKAWAGGRGDRGKYETLLNDLAVTEEFHGYPGLKLMSALKEASGDAAASLALATRITTALMTRSFRQHAGDGAGENGDDSMPELVPSTLGRAETRRPYFETLIVTGHPATSWQGLAAEWRKLRRPLDGFIYEPVIVGSLEDAFSAVMLNPNIAAVVINEGFALRSRHDAPVLRSITASANLSNETVKLVHGVVNLEQAGRIVLLLDPAELLTRAERGLLDTFRAKAERAVL